MNAISKLGFLEYFKINSLSHLSRTQFKVIAVAALIFIVLAQLGYKTWIKWNYSKELNQKSGANPIPDFDPAFFLSLKEQTSKVELIPFDLSNCRFDDILCPKESCLKGERGGWYYLHANHVNLDSEYPFIATQYPLESHFPLFWEMAKNCSLIVDLTNSKDINKDRLKLYYPLLNETIVLGSMRVTCTDLKPIQDLEGYFADYQIEHLGKTCIVTRFHFKEWPDGKDIPENDLEKIDGIIASFQKKNKKPIAVHCRAGVGRTGTVIVKNVSSHLIKRKVINASNLKEELAKLILKGRKDRGPFFVQTKEQLKVIWDSACSLIKKMS